MIFPPNVRRSTITAAMIDRPVHHAEVLTLTGEAYRTRARRESG
jgi:DNA replication protein DnaC